MADKTLSGLDYLTTPTDVRGSLCVVSGDEGFVKHEVVVALRGRLVGEGDGELGWQSFAGAEADWPTVHDAASARSLFGGSDRPAAYVDDADPFVTRYRDELERFAEGGGPGVVVLNVRSLPGNTRLAKRVAEHGLHVRCDTPTKGAEVAKHRRATAKWLAHHARAVHGRPIEADALDLLLERLPASVGVLDQEVARLALLAEGDGPIDTRLVDAEVGGWRTRTAWDLIDAAVEGRAADALTQLDRLLLAGEQPIGLLAQLGSTLRRFGAAGAAVEAAERAGRRVGLRGALEQAGVVRFKLGDAERQLRQLGRERARQLGGWVLDADLAMKGHSSTPARARTQLERLIVRLSTQAAAKPSPARR